MTRSDTRCMVLLLILAACTCLTLTGCGGTKPPGTTPGVDETAMLPGNEPAQLSLAETIAGINFSPVPPGVEHPLYEQLRAELVRVITEEAARSTSIPPTGELNAVTDLVLQSDDVAGWQLQWSYVNVGDYDLNGMVNISDLTPIGLNFNATIGDPDWDVAQYADGDANGVVNISDITPVGQNFQSFISGFNVYGATSIAGPWTLVDSLPCPDSPTEGPFLVSYSLATNDYATYRVVPFDADSFEGQLSWPNAIVPEPAEVTLGADNVVATQTIGAGGGTISATGGSPIDGVSITFPPGALPADTSVSLGYNDGIVILPQGEVDLPILLIEAGEVLEFTEPAQITVPFTADEDTMPLAFYIREDGSLDGMQAVDYDHVTDTFTFDTFHTSPFTVVHVKTGDVNQVLMHLGYMQLADDFWVKNVATRYADGKCLGMSVFSKWYFDNISLGKTNRLYDSYRTLLQSPPVRFTQDVIATRAQLAVHRYYKDYTPAIVGRGYVAGHKYNYNAIINMMAIMGSPQVVILDSPDSQHAVLAHSIVLLPDDPNQVQLLVYDPNFPGNVNKLHYYHATESFKTYTSGATTYTKFIHFGTGTIKYAESFEDILVDANQNFHGSTTATIEILSHTSGATVTTQLVDLSGVVHSGEALIEKLTIRNGTEAVEAELGVNGEFRVDVPMHAGTNYLSFHTQGYNVDNRLLTIHNNLLTSGFILEADLPPPAHLTITSHVNNAPVYTKEITLAGTVTGSLIPVDQVKVYVNGNGPYASAVDAGGQFDVGLVLYYGENRLTFHLTGQVDGKEAVVPHDLTTPFLLNGEFTANAIDITMYMDPRLDLPSGNSMNLYVIDPTGDYAWQSHNQTADGGHLTTNWDPDHDPPCYQQRFKLGYDDTVRWGQNYTVRIQWREDMPFAGGHIDPPAHYEVRIVLCEGYATEEIINLAGDIDGPNDWYNNAPDATGPDWADVTVVSPLQP